MTRPPLVSQPHSGRFRYHQVTQGAMTELAVQFFSRDNVCLVGFLCGAEISEAHLPLIFLDVGSPQAGGFVKTRSLQPTSYSNPHALPRCGHVGDALRVCIRIITINRLEWSACPPRVRR